jgi:hypothetical protein
LEIGGHLPESTSRGSELLIECFGRETAYQCRPDLQAITLEGTADARYLWSANPAGQMISELLELIENDREPVRGPHDDVETMSVCERIRSSAKVA